MPPGTVPPATEATIEEEQYGHDVFVELSKSYELETDDRIVNRVRDVIDTLTTQSGLQQQVWHSYVFHAPDLKNAAATRGNFIFIWSGMVDAVQSDAELAAVLAHEIAHVLARHPFPTASERASELISGVSGRVARDVLVSQGSTATALAGLAGVLLEQILRASMVNPEQQRKELEADQIGLFLMADAGYDPQAALDFWSRMRSEEALEPGGFLQFLSTHPSSNERLVKLSSYLEPALQRYRGETIPPARPTERPMAPLAPSRNNRLVFVQQKIPVFESPSHSKKIISVLNQDQSAELFKLNEEWFEVRSPVKGFIPKSYVQIE